MSNVETILESIEKLTLLEAAELVKYNDEMLHSRYKYVTGTYRGDRKNRHMLIDSSVLGIYKTAEYIMQLIDLRFEEE